MKKHFVDFAVYMFCLIGSFVMGWYWVTLMIGGFLAGLLLATERLAYWQGELIESQRRRIYLEQRRADVLQSRLHAETWWKEANGS